MASASGSKLETYSRPDLATRPAGSARGLISLILRALAIAMTTRLFLAGVVWLSMRIFPRFGLYPVQLPDSFFPDDPVIDGWARWDTAHYVAIAQLGYGSDNPSPHGGLGFFPFYPLLMRGAVELVGAAPTERNLALAGLLIANVAFLAVVALITWIGTVKFGERVGLEAAVLLCIAPFSFFFNAAYTESLFLALALASLAAADRGRWWLAGIAAGFATFTRLIGLALPPALLLLAWRRGARFRDLAVATLLSVSGTLAYFGYCAWRFNNPLAYFDAQATWGGWDEHVRFYAELFFLHPRQALGGRPEDLIVAIGLALAIVYLAFLPLVWKRLDWGLATYTTLIIVVQGAMVWVSLGRYVLPAAGVYLAAALWFTSKGFAHRYGWVRDAVLVSSTLLLSFLAVLYAHGFWVV
ncbi:MAG TPA: mannosyltransferase family protein [Thermomicrobiales bacterium]